MYFSAGIRPNYDGIVDGFIPDLRTTEAMEDLGTNSIHFYLFNEVRKRENGILLAILLPDSERYQCLIPSICPDQCFGSA